MASFKLVASTVMCRSLSIRYSCSDPAEQDKSSENLQFKVKLWEWNFTVLCDLMIRIFALELWEGLSEQVSPLRVRVWCLYIVGGQVSHDKTHTPRNMTHDTLSHNAPSSAWRRFPNISNLSFKFWRSDNRKGSALMVYNIIIFVVNKSSPIRR